MSYRNIVLTVLLLLIGGQGWIPTSGAQELTDFERKSDLVLRRVYRLFIPGPYPTLSGDQAGERQRLRERVRLESRPEGTSVGVIITLREGSEASLVAAQSSLAALGVQIRARIGNIAVATVPVTQLPKLAVVEAVVSLHSSGFSHSTTHRAAGLAGRLTHRALKAANDAANSSINAPAARTDYGVNGAGVVIGVIDSGIDWKHGDFRRADGTTRIKFLWDMSDSANSGPGSVGAVHTEAEINAALQGRGTVNAKDTNNHGTHVAGIAGGNGLGTANGVAPGAFAGIAPGADLVIVKASRAGSEGFSNDDQIAALAWIRERAAQLNEPFVINMSLGGHTSQHDGTDRVEKAIDQLLSEAPNRQVVLAAGNEGAAPLHAGGVLDQDAETFVPFTLSEKSNLLLAVYNAADRINFSVIKPDNTVVGPVDLGNALTSDTDLEIEHAPGVAESGANTFLIAFKKKPAGTFKLRLTGASIVNGRWDVWDTADGATPLDPSVRDGLQHVGSPATSRRAIAAANYVVKTSFTNVNNTVVNKTDEGEIGAGANSSSTGPTRDGRIKPEIGAPGAYLVSTLSADAANPDQGDISADGRHIAYTGTSMATPVTTGVIALMLQKAKERNRSLTSDQIKRILWRTVTNDSYTGPSISRKFGFGKINARAAVKAVEDNVTAAEFVSVSAADYRADLVAAPDAILAGFGAGLASGVSAATAVPLPTELGGVRIRVTDSRGTSRFAPLFFVAPTQINYTIPTETAPGVAIVEVVREGNVVANGAVSVNAVWPGFFTTNGAGTGAAAINVIRVRGSQVIYDNPALPIDLSIQGDTVYAVLFGTGTRGRTSLDNVRMTLGGRTLPLAYVGPQGAYAGLDQINALIPASLAGRGALDLVVYVDGLQTNTVRLTIK